MSETTAPLAVWTGYTGALTAPGADLLHAFADRVFVPVHALRSALIQVAGRPVIPPTAGPVWAAAVEAVLEAEFGVSCDLSRAQELWLELSRPNRAWIDRLAELKAQGVFVGLLTDVPEAREPGWLRLLAPRLFDAVIRRADGPLGALSLHEATLEADRAAADCLLVDAAPAHCAEARQEGWQAVEFRDTTVALAELDRRLAGPAPVLA